MGKHIAGATEAINGQARLPKGALDAALVAHFYEAVLAALAVLIWHLYTVIFDADVYPMGATWLAGRFARRRGANPAEIATPSEESTPQPEPGAASVWIEERRSSLPDGYAGQ